MNKRQKKSRVYMIVVVSIFMGGILGYFLFGSGTTDIFGVADRVDNTALAPVVDTVGAAGSLFFNIIVTLFGAFAMGVASAMFGFIYLMLQEQEK